MTVTLFPGRNPPPRKPSDGRPYAVLTLIQSPRFGMFLFGTLDAPEPVVQKMVDEMNITRLHAERCGSRGPRPQMPSMPDDPDMLA